MACSLANSMGCVRPATSQLQANHDFDVGGKHAKAAIQFFVTHPYYIDDLTFLKLADCVRHGPNQSQALYALALSGRPDVPALLDDLEKTPGSGSAAVIDYARSVWQKAAEARALGPQVATTGNATIHPRAENPPADTGDDIVRLKDGGRVTGRVIVDDKDEVVVELVDKTTKRIARSDVIRIEYVSGR